MTMDEKMDKLKQSLTENDAAVLNAILNPFLPTGHDDSLSSSAVASIDDTQAIPTETKVSSSELDGGVGSAKSTDDTDSIAMPIEAAAIKLAEGGDIDGSLALFNSVIDRYPLRSSAYNNRAQLHRLRLDTKCKPSICCSHPNS